MLAFGGVVARTVTARIRREETWTEQRCSRVGGQFVVCERIVAIMAGGSGGGGGGDGRRPFASPFVNRPPGVVDSMAAVPSFLPSRKSLKGIVAGKTDACVCVCASE